MGYGGGMVPRQVSTHAPDNQFIGLAFLEGWKWIISRRGYANLVQSPGDVVYGLVYTVSSSDEANLDVFEGVPNMYSKFYLNITMGTQEKPGTRHRSLLYIDGNFKDPAPAPQDYIVRMNEVIEECRKLGMPEGYIETYLRTFIPPPADA
ncbi:hypothetical protein Agabi119p4_3367 [Agaricus bisporus var. burnettii]|uniref:gamma-glutamylcyclotransferase n=1 Tax=Agaricus bisporus var. burnettii TaxID=192524 RepID=A0A8H7F6Y4_AGABI|nr:hypothetical protein Agabi119p4_3367 [Agaricus bisporus var. burnettii]